MEERIAACSTVLIHGPWILSSAVKTVLTRMFFSLNIFMAYTLYVSYVMLTIGVGSRKFFTDETKQTPLAVTFNFILQFGV